jgi:hypothetical protein
MCYNSGMFKKYLSYSNLAYILQQGLGVNPSNSAAHKKDIIGENYGKIL